MSLTFASWNRIASWLRSAYPPNRARLAYVAMKMTGHKTDSVFRRYDIVSAGNLRDAARKLDQMPSHREKQA